MACMTAATFLPVRGAPTTDQPEAVTSDTPEYCMHLLDKVSALVRSAPSSPPPEVSSLSTEGEKMCAHGQTRGGILRLRRAFLLMQSYRAP
jgi:hypothetical protein